MLNYTFLDEEVDGKPDDLIIAIYTEHIDAYKSHPNFPEAYARLFHRRGKMFCKIKDYRSAIDDINIAVKFEKDMRYNALGSRAVVHNYLKEYSLARVDYLEALKVIDKHIAEGKPYELIKTRLNYGMAQTLFNLKRYKEAIKYFELVYLGELPDSLPEGFVNYGRCYSFLGNYKMADKVLKACEKGSPGDFYPKIYVAMNSIEWAMNSDCNEEQLNQALFYIKEIRKLRPDLEALQNLVKKYQLLLEK